ncbi:nitronate monooxygenase [Chitinophaga skermanii]|uniref:Nitronate monooxygenase n=1 Tax=Chitinophaga skermanii TaxID=331697 RepID=A0A327R4W1_9BACT|nr:nitronate monooxygenase [Chitinophaga skermanii]RAJ11118.1 nitronate monooxygenase [Chitinophaga skermanii]
MKNGWLPAAYPIVQAPMLGVTSPAMVAAAANAGALGSLPVGGLSYDQTAALIQAVKSLTKLPFAVNLFVHDIPSVIDEQAFDDMQVWMQQTADKYQLAFQPLQRAQLQFFHYTEQLPLLVDPQIAVVSFTFGNLNSEAIQFLHQHNKILVGTATSAEEAKVLDESGIDVITAQGIEAGGHRGAFLHPEQLPQIGLLTLLQSIQQVTKKPIIAAGGIGHAAAAKAAMVAGAQAVQIGSLFLASNESLAIPAYKTAVLQSKDTSTALTRAFSGRWARGIQNTFMQLLEKEGIDIPPYPVQNSLTTGFRKAAQAANNSELTNLWAGQMANKAREASTTIILQELIAAGKAVGAW